MKPILLSLLLIAFFSPTTGSCKETDDHGLFVSRVLCLDDRSAVDGPKKSVELILHDEKKSYAKLIHETLGLGKPQTFSQRIENLGCKVNLEAAVDNSSFGIVSVFCHQDRFDEKGQAIQLSATKNNISSRQFVLHLTTLNQGPRSDDGIEIGTLPIRQTKELGRAFKCSIILLNR